MLIDLAAPGALVITRACLTVRIKHQTHALLLRRSKTHGRQMSVNAHNAQTDPNEQASPTLPSQGAGGTTAPRAAAFTHTVCSMQSAPHSAGNGGASSSPGCESQQGPPLGTSSRTSELAPPLMVIQFYKSRSNRAWSIEGSRCRAAPHVEYLARR